MSANASEFVVHKHTRGEDVHWDLMLLWKDALLTWRVEREPEEFCEGVIEAVRIADHDLKFLSYEGAVNNEAGMVAMAARGTCGIQFVSKQAIEIEFESTNLAGRFKLQRVDGDRWQLELLA